MTTIILIACAGILAFIITSVIIILNWDKPTSFAAWLITKLPHKHHNFWGGETLTKEMCAECYYQKFTKDRKMI